jgi:(2R)-sulfolactate sulfo-lyase subunit alpha
MIHFIAHGRHDVVGVAVVDLKKGQKVKGWNMFDDSTISAKATQDIPLGHKIALTEVAKGDAIVKYDEAIGTASKAIAKGQHVHTHNLKTARW